MSDWGTVLGPGSMRCLSCRGGFGSGGCSGEQVPALSGGEGHFTCTPVAAALVRSPHHTGTSITLTPSLSGLPHWTAIPATSFVTFR